MPYRVPPALDRERVLRHVAHVLPVAVVLAGVAGYVNAVALDFIATPVSHMSGAVSHLGVNLGEGRMGGALAALMIIGGFLLGAVLSGMLVGASPLGPGRRYSVALALEAVLIGVGVVVLRPDSVWGVPGLAMACGLQNATTSSYCGMGIRTTHVTGTMTDLGVMVGHWLRHRSLDRRKFRFIAGMALGFGGGAVAGAWSVVHLGPSCLLGPAVVCAAAAAVLWWSSAPNGWLHRDLQRGERSAHSR